MKGYYLRNDEVTGRIDVYEKGNDKIAGSFRVINGKVSVELVKRVSKVLEITDPIKQYKLECEIILASRNGT